MLTFEAGDRLRAAANPIAEATLARDYAERPHLMERFGDYGRTRYRQDILYNVAALSAALDAADAGVFLQYVAWLKVVLLHRGVASEDVAESLRCMSAALAEDKANDHSAALSFLQAALERLDSMPATVASFIAPSSQEHAIARRCLEALLLLDSGAAHEALKDAIDDGVPLARIYTRVLPPLMREIGRRWQINEISVAHEHYCSAAVQSILSSLYGRIFGVNPILGRSIIVACVEGEQHEIGAHSMADVFQLNGWSTTYLGANLPLRDLIKMLSQARRPPQLIALSATMPAHLVKMAFTIAAIREVLKVPIIVGGYLFQGSPGLAARLGADGSADDAEAALALADSLVARSG